MLTLREIKELMRQRSAPARRASARLIASDATAQSAPVDKAPRGKSVLDLRLTLAAETEAKKPCR